MHHNTNPGIHEFPTVFQCAQISSLCTTFEVGCSFVCLYVLLTVQCARVRNFKVAKQKCNTAVFEKIPPNDWLSHWQRLPGLQSLLLERTVTYLMATLSQNTGYTNQIKTRDFSEFYSHVGFIINVLFLQLYISTCLSISKSNVKMQIFVYNYIYFWL